MSIGRRRKVAGLLCGLAVLACGGPAAADDVAGNTVQEQGMQITGKTERAELAQVKIEQEIAIAAPPERVFAAYVNELARWYSRDFIMGGELTVDFVLEAEPGGRLMEVFDGGGGMVWAEVIAIRPGRMIRLGIPEGVVWSGPGYFVLRFEPADEGGTLLKLEHQCTQAFSEDGHSGYVYGWTELLGTGLKQYVETGAAENPVKP